MGVIGIVLGILLTTTVLTEIVTNNAAAAVVVPIALIGPPSRWSSTSGSWRSAWRWWRRRRS